MKRKISAKNAEWLACTALIWSFLVACLIFLVAYWNYSQATYLEGWHLLGGVPVWLLVWLHIRQQRLADEEKQVPKPDTRTPADASLFAKEEADPFSAQSRLYFFEKWVMPITTMTIGTLLFLGGMILAYRHLKQGTTAVATNAPLSAAFLSGFAFFSFLIAKYSLGMAKQSVWRLLKAGGNYLFLNSLFCFLCAIFVSLTHLELLAPERYLALTIPAIMALLGIEMLLNLVLDIYRPRILGQEIHPPYESRFLELFTSSKGILTTAAQTLDYQFGFKVSETWFYQFLERNIAPLVLFQLLSLYLLSCIVVVKPEEQAVIERFGRPQPTALGPGCYGKWPWPIEAVYHYPVNRIQTLELGSHDDDEDEAAEDQHKGHSHKKTQPKPLQRANNLLFNKNHAHEEYNFLTACTRNDGGDKSSNTPVNLFTIHVWMQYRIGDLSDYMYRHSQPVRLLEGIGYREVTQFLATVPMDNVLTVYNRDGAAMLKSHIQQQCDRVRLGIQLLSVNITSIHAPVPVADEFIAVMGAREEMRAKILQAETYQQQVLPIAKAEAVTVRLEAGNYLEEKLLLTQAEAQAFANFATAYVAGGDLYLERKYLKILEKTLPGKRLYLLHLPGTESEVTVVNLEDQFSTSLFQLDMSETQDSQKR